MIGWRNRLQMIYYIEFFLDQNIVVTIELCEFYYDEYEVQNINYRVYKSKINKK